jgi:hypothetical protein
VVGYFLYNELFSQNFVKKILGTVLVFLMVFSAAIDIFRTFTPASVYQIYSNSDLEVAKSVKNLTLKNSVFVTASNHNHPIPTLTGRSTYIGFNGWVWSHGIDFSQRANEVALIYLGGPTAEELIIKNRINYIAVGPVENSSYAINHLYFSRFPTINIYTDWVIYDVSSLWANSYRQN